MKQLKWPISLFSLCVCVVYIVKWGGPVLALAVDGEKLKMFMNVVDNLPLLSMS